MGNGPGNGKTCHAQEGNSLAIHFDCTGCATRINVPDSAAGRRAKCPLCNTLQRVPLTSLVNDDPPPPEEEPAPAVDSPAEEPSLSEELAHEPLPADSLEEVPPEPEPPAPAPPQFETPEPESPAPLDVEEHEPEEQEPLFPAPDDLEHRVSESPRRTVGERTRSRGPQLSALRTRNALDPAALSTAKVPAYVTRFAWLTLKDNLGACLLFGIVMAILSLPMQLFEPIVEEFYGEELELRDYYFIGAVYFAAVVLFHTLKVGISALFGLAILRGDPMPVAAIGKVVPYLLKLFLLILFVDSIIAAAFAVIISPLLLHEWELASGTTLLLIHVGVATVVIPLLVSFLLGIYPAEYFIVDCSTGVWESMRLSRRHMARNRWGLFSALFWTHLLAGIALFVSCYLATLVTMPYFALLATSYYLASTGQLKLPDIK